MYMAVSPLFNCNENIVLKRAFPKEFLQNGLFSAMVALKKALKGKKLVMFPIFSL